MAPRTGSLRLLLTLLNVSCGLPLSVKSSFFLGKSLVPLWQTIPAGYQNAVVRSGNDITMRKQKASDRRTRRRQRGIITEEDKGALTVTESPMRAVGPWRGKAVQPLGLAGAPSSSSAKAGGRGRSRKRSMLYNSLSTYHNHFLSLLTYEYQLEESEVLGRIKASLDDPMALEKAGYALFDMIPSKRGKLFSDEVYRLSRANDTAVPFSSSQELDPSSSITLPPNHKFAKNDVIMVTLQPHGSGDFFNPESLPTNEQAISVEARVINSGPTYIDVAIATGQFDAAFGTVSSGRHIRGDKPIRLRIDRFLSKIPYQRMVQALAQITSVYKPTIDTPVLEDSNNHRERHPFDAITMDDVIRNAILATHAYADPRSPLYQDSDTCDLQEIAVRVSKPPMHNSFKLAAEVIKFIESEPGLFQKLDVPQLAAIESALSRRMTMIQGPPGSGKTTVAAAIGFGFAKQCRQISPHTKVLACAFSNIGADNLADAMLRIGLKVIRVGKASAVSESLWDVTLDAAIDRDENAQRALDNAARATARLSSLSRGSNHGLPERVLREAATVAVKESIRACNLAAIKALREADVIVSTSSGAADSRLLAACGMMSDESEDLVASKNNAGPSRSLAPDNLPPLSLPFVLVDEACQGMEPATLIPIVSSNSCRALVLLGDPCQLPPTVRSSQANPLSLSLMERLSLLLPRPTVSSRVDKTVSDTSYLESLAIKQSRSLVRSMEQQPTTRSYRRRFSGCLLLSVQYRMHPSISAFPSAIFYDGLLSTPEVLGQARSFPIAFERLMPGPDQPQCIRVINVGGRSNERLGSDSDSALLSSHETRSYWNAAEAHQVISLVKAILREEDGLVDSIGIISPYNAQVQFIKSMMASDSDLRQLLANNKRPLSIEIKSVDGYQGRERDVIIFSSVRSNRQGRIGFLHDWRRMNVAMTRAKSAFLLVGDLATLSETDRHWAAFRKYADSLGIIFGDRL